ncbi:unnamed protein product [Scytosiphon promiscuus]
MIACMRARALPLARLPRSSLARPLPRSWVVGFSSASDKHNSNSNSTSNSSTSTSGGANNSSVDGSAADLPAASPPEPGAGTGFDPAALIAQAPPPPPAAAAEAASGAEPWSSAAAAHQFLTDFPSSLTPLMADAGMSLLYGALSIGGQVTGGIQSGMETIHNVTGLPWWATIAVATVGVKVSLFPVVVYQAGHMDRVRMAWPEIQVLRGHLASTLEEIPQRRALERWRKYKIFFSGTRGILGLHGTHALGILATPLVNLPVFITFVWSIRGMLRDATVPGLDTGGILWFVDLTATDSSLMLPIIGTLFTYTSLEMVKMKGATGWIKFFQDGMQTFIILTLPWISTFPQGVFMYWIPSSAFQMGQAYAMKNDRFRGLFGLQALKAPPRPAAGGAPPPAGQEAVGVSTDQKSISPPSSQAVA